jgi:hypothetical protein
MMGNVSSPSFRHSNGRDGLHPCLTLALQTLVMALQANAEFSGASIVHAGPRLTLLILQFHRV